MFIRQRATMQLICEVTDKKIIGRIRDTFLNSHLLVLVCFDALHPSPQIFSHVRLIPGLI